MVGTASASAKPEIIEAPAPSAMRSPADVLRALIAALTLLVVVIVQWLFGDSLVGFAADLFRGLDALPTWLTTTLSVALRVLAIVFLLGGFVAALVRGRWRLLLSATLAAVGGALLFLLVDAMAPSAGPVVTDINDAVGPLTDRGFPTAGALAAIAAIVAATAPWLGRNMRRAGWTLVWGLIVARFALAPLGFDTATAALSGWFVGSLVVVLLGGPSRRPTGAAIADGLARVGVPLARLEQASLDARGSTPYFAVGADGQRLFVKALGLDERSADLLFRMYRRIQPRDFGDEKAFSSLRRAVEHEALVALTARDLGVATPRVVAFTTADPNGFVLAYEAIDGRSLDRVAPEEVNDDVLGAIWAQIALLRAHRIAHRDLRLANVFLAADGTASIIDFGFSELAASDLLLATDLAELLASSALQVGFERAVARGVDAVGAEALATAIPRLRPSALSGATRTAYKQQAAALDELRSRVASACEPRTIGR
jgi:glycosyltransferase 2 family protein